MDYERILINGLNGMGDFVYYTPVLKAVRERYPEAHITLLNWLVTKDLAVNCPYIDELLVPEEMREQCLQHASDVGTGFAKIINLKERYDLLLDFGCPPLSTLITIACRARRRMSFKGGGPADRFYTDLIEKNSHEHIIYQYLKFLSLLEIGIPAAFPPPVWPPEQDKKDVAAFMKLNFRPDETLIGIHPGCGVVNRRWAPEKFAELADRLVETYGARIILFGSRYIRTAEEDDSRADEVMAAEKISRLMKIKPVNLAGKGSMNQFAVVVTYLRLYIGHDTGPSHITAALNIPILTIFGPANPALWQPLGRYSYIVRKEMDCSPCGASGCEDNRCLKELEVDQVWAACQQVIKDTA
ncbi:MAG: glycosyltransferase family 9 protein [bacterium]